MKRQNSTTKAQQPASSASPDLPSKHELEQQHQILLTPPPIWSRVLIWSLSIGSLSLFAWSWFNKIDETTSLPGQLETIRSEVVIKSPENALVSRINATAHKTVQSKQVLFLLDRDDIEPRLNSLRKRLVMLFDKNVYEQSALTTRMRQAQAEIELNADLVRRLDMLVRQGSVQEVQLLEKRNALVQSQANYDAIVDEKSKSSVSYRIESNDVIGQIKELQQKERQYSILSPISGTIQKVGVQANGERVAAGDVLATVVPHEGLIASVQVPSKLAAPIAPGKAADITVDAFPSNDYGVLKGTIESISPTASTDNRSQNLSYTARIRISNRNIPKAYPIGSLKSGMGVTARIVLHKKPVIGLVFDFVNDTFKPMAERR